MTVIVSVPSAQYNPRTLTVNPSIPAGTTKLQITLTREAWPVGAVGSISIRYPDGSPAMSSTFDGGVISNPFTGAPITKQSMVLTGLFNDGVVQPLPAGTYAVDVVILQTLTTSVLAERF